jgi:hypothetical protein
VLNNRCCTCTSSHLHCVDYCYVSALVAYVSVQTDVEWLRCLYPLVCMLLCMSLDVCMLSRVLFVAFALHVRRRNLVCWCALLSRPLGQHGKNVLDWQGKQSAALVLVLCNWMLLNSLRVCLPPIAGGTPEWMAPGERRRAASNCTGMHAHQHACQHHCHINIATSTCQHQHACTSTCMHTNMLANTVHTVTCPNRDTDALRGMQGCLCLA